MQVNPESGLASTCPATDLSTTPHPFNPPLSEYALVELLHKNFSPETVKKVFWVRKMYHDWMVYRHSLGLEFISCDLENKSTINESSLKFATYRFITAVKKVHGEDFSDKTLYDIVICIQFHPE